MRPPSKSRSTKSAARVAATATAARQLSRLSPLQLLGELVLHGIPIFFSLQIGAVFAVVPIFERYYADAGARLPFFTQFAIDARPAWLVVALAFAVLPFVLPKKAQPRRTIVRLLVLSGFVSFLTAQTLTFALYLPVLQLNAPAS